MLRVTIELLPGGSAVGRRTIGVINIGNDGTGTPEVGNYNVSASHAGKFFDLDRGPYKTGRVVGFLRKLSPYRLLFRALKAMGET